ncbi:Nicotinate-nucleotide--dimethylbenzimidazole phosphoribosyltransferase [hydrothermal vent metagenome]|uniref:Nicotinate-nucleotide--dimethylbenzimidazole phosphoribosyltransferase n=1 Tax=hydrothermal vent metagenome TaxID=652676 RepID=A0A3B1DMB2_9ZZZZ
MNTIKNTLAQITALDPKWQSRAQNHLDRLTKPPGSLGRLEEIARWFIQVRGKFPPALPQKMLFTFAADHGVTDEGVSAFPKSVTAQMVHNFLKGGAAVNVLARHTGAEVRVVDIGVDADFKSLPNLIHRKIARGTKNMAEGPAMSRQAAETSLKTGIALAEKAMQEGVTLLGAGEMGIGNTTAASAITAVLCKAPVNKVTGRGTGVDDAALAHKQKIIDQAIRVNQPDSKDPLDILVKVGGFEIGGMAGLILGAAANRIPMIIDGFISTSAALIAVALKPAVSSYLLVAHQSVEPGHQIALQHLGLSPLLDLDMRLGEGTGAVLAMGMVDAAIKIVNEMATFEQAGVSNKTEPA